MTRKQKIAISVAIVCFLLFILLDPFGTDGEGYMVPPVYFGIPIAVFILIVIFTGRNKRKI
jgi:hypothetical protein